MDNNRLRSQKAVQLTRSTVNKDPMGPEKQAINDGLHWIWSWQLQLRRLQASTFTQISGDTEVEKLRSYSAASYDEHMLLVAGRNLIKALEEVEKHFSMPSLNHGIKQAIRLLRNLYEHWDEHRVTFQTDAQKKRSAKEFEKLFPDGIPWSISYAKSDWLIGGVVPINEVTRQLDTMEEKLLKLRKDRTGK